MENTAIGWCHHTFNGWIGCVEAGPECDFCYARTQANRYPRTRGLWGKDAPRLPTSDAYWRKPDAWNRKAAKNGRRARVFASSMCDILERGAALDVLRARLWPIMERTTWLDWLLLTKRPDGYRDLVPAHWHAGGWPPNVWAGTTCGTRAGLARVRTLCQAAAPARVRFVSAEPLLEAIDFSGVLVPQGVAASTGAYDAPPVQWIIFGFESGPHARSGDLAWIRRGVAACHRYRAAAFVKQLGKRPTTSDDDDKRHCGDMNLPSPFVMKLEDSAGADPYEWPEDLRVQEFP